MPLSLKARPLIESGEVQLMAHKGKGLDSIAGKEFNSLLQFGRRSGVGRYEGKLLSPEGAQIDGEVR